MKEIYIDRISNINIQGPIVSLDFARSKSNTETKEIEFDPKIKLTLTTQNFMALVTTLNQTAQAISEKIKEQAKTKKNDLKSKDSGKPKNIK